MPTNSVLYKRLDSNSRELRENGAVVQLLRMVDAGAFGRVRGVRPTVDVKVNPFRARVGEVILTLPKLEAVIDGRLKIEARPLGWVLVGKLKHEYRKPHRPEAWRREPDLKPAAREKWMDRREAYLREKALAQQPDVW